jgi:NAD(P)H-quinone oxidoreductase subunit 5
VEHVRVARAGGGAGSARLPLLLLSFAGALVIYLLVGALFDHGVTRSPAVLTLGALFIMGLFVFLARGASSQAVLLRVLPVAAVAAALYFSLQIAAAMFFAPLLPAVPPLGIVGIALVTLVLLSFAALSLFQVMPPAIERRWYRAAYVHLANGLYANAVFNKLTGALRRDSTLRT